ncbi:sulfatase-like hydrolase/transferase [Flammeovirga sp. SubArs3]|uniref:sulfatase-like hydrolase/transferase n=1 Tax=Flammeovirga sp. SubArs3 TaxID=2995316 RepID=UPI00248A972E|nr:sulfatase-like hydrolase/transferase [Flammeovirga sp. SubArs3]
MKYYKAWAIGVLLFCSTQVWAQSPNFIVIVADDLGYSDVGYHQYRTDIPTPNIDALATKGVHFTEGYVTAPVCAPSRSGLLTGTYQQRFGFKDNPGPFRPSPEIVPGISHDYPTLAQELKEAGYKTAAIGKWHLGGQEDNAYIPYNKGFDYYYGFLGGASSYYFEDHATQFFLENDTPIQTPNKYLTTLFGDKAVEYIQQQDQEQPFFMYWAPNAVHSPLEAPKEVLAQFSHIEDPMRKKLVAMQYVMDQNIGRIVQALKEQSLLENTMIVFISDNGGKPNDNASYNLPLNGQKGTLYEGGIRVPYFMYYPSKIAANQKYEKMVTSLDIMPTILSLAGKTPTNALDGVDLLPYLNEVDNKAPHQDLYWKNANKWGVRDLEWKLFYDQKNDKVRLYHIANDPYEEHDVYDQYPNEVERLTQMYTAWDSKNATYSWGWNPAAIGKYKVDNQFTFEELISEKFSSVDFEDVMVVPNTKKEGLNTSNQVMHLKMGEKKGTLKVFARYSPMMKKGHRFGHLKVRSKQPFTVTMKLNGDTKAITSQKAHKEYNGNDEWQDLVFDFSEWKGKKSKGITLEFSGVEHNEDIFVDDIWWNNQGKEIIDNVSTKVENVALYPSIYNEDKQVVVWKNIPNVEQYIIKYKGEVIGTTDKNYHLLPKEYEKKELNIKGAKIN